VIGAERDWLPIEVLSRESLKTSLCRTIDAWSAHWFAAKTLQARSFQIKARGDAGSVDGWRLYREDIALRTFPSGAGKLAEWALDMGPSDREASNADRIVLEALSSKILADLVLRLTETLGVPAPASGAPGAAVSGFGRDGGLEVTVADGHGPDVLALALGRRVLLGAIRRGLPPRKQGAALARRRQSLASSNVVLEAFIGQAVVSLSDVLALAPGDIVDLAVSIDHFAELSLAGTSRAIALGEMVTSDDQVTFKLHAST